MFFFFCFFWLGLLHFVTISIMLNTAIMKSIHYKGVLMCPVVYDLLPFEKCLRWGNRQNKVLCVFFSPTANFNFTVLWIQIATNRGKCT